MDLRFPGYENVAVVDGVPEGWKIGILQDLAELKAALNEFSELFLFYENGHHPLSQNVRFNAPFARQSHPEHGQGLQ